MRDVMLYRETDPAGCFVGNCDREIGFGFVPDDAVEPVARVGVRVGMGKPVTQVDPNVSIVCVTDDRISIAPFPATDRARC
jgi:hypothetical protein